MTIVSYDAEKHSTSVFRLWQAAIGQVWPLDETRLQLALRREGMHFVALDDDGNVVGLVATSIQERAGHISLLLVVPERQGQGIGTTLHDAALTHFRRMQVSTAFLGGGSTRFFPGLPGNLPQALAFFQARHWNFENEPYHITYDLIQDVRGYVTPPYIQQRAASQHISFSTINQTQGEELLEFEAREFPNWLSAFERVIALGDYDDLLVGRDEMGRIVASLIMYTPTSHGERLDVLWQGVFGKKTGAIGCVGVAQKEQGRGIGIALVARATELLLEDGVEHVYIDWVVLTEFYAKLGYHIWRGYHMGWRDLE